MNQTTYIKLLLSLYVTVLCCLSGCTVPENPLSIPEPTEIITPVESTEKEEEKTQDKKEEKDGSLEEEIKESVNVKEVNNYLENAGHALSGNYNNFLSREPQHFAPVHLLTSLYEDIQELPDKLRTIQSNIARTPPTTSLAALWPLLITLLFCILLTSLDRQSHTFFYKWQSSYYSPLSNVVTRSIRGLILIIGRITGPLLLLGLCYFPVTALFGSETWTALLRSTFWILVVYRLISSIIEVLIAYPWFEIRDEHADKLHHTLLLLTQIIAIASQVYFMLIAMHISKENQSFIAFTFELFLAIIPLGFIRIRHELTGIFESHKEEEQTFYRTGLLFLMKHYRSLLIITCLLLAMRAFGYVNASTTLLTRSYGLIGLLLAGTIVLRSTRRFFDQRLQSLQPQDPQRELLFSIKRLLTMALAIIIVMSAAKVLAIYTPLLIILKTPLLTLQSVNFSLFNLLSAFLIVGAAVLSSKIVRAILNAKVYPSLNVDIGVAYAINTIVGYAVIVVGFFLVLIALGVNLSALTVVAASLSVGIGFGLQTLTENLISGFIILFGRTVRKGDYITINDVYGKVEAVGARSVVVRTPDNYDLLIPSKELVGGALINWTYQDSIVRLHVPVGVSYSCNPKEIEKILLKVAKEYEKIEQSIEPEVWLVGFGDNSVNFELLLHYDCRKIVPKRILGELNYRIWDALQEADVEIPFPQRDLHLRSMDILPELKNFLTQRTASAPSDESSKAQKKDTTSDDNDDKEENG